jgi:hypothetical protein
VGGGVSGVPALASLIVSRWQLGPDSHWLSLALLAASILLRPLFYRSICNAGKGAWRPFPTDRRGVVSLWSVGDGSERPERNEVESKDAR